MGSCSFLGGLLAVFLPETLGAKLPEKISEIKSLYANPKPWWKWISKSHLKNLRSKMMRRVLKNHNRKSYYI